MKSKITYTVYANYVNNYRIENNWVKIYELLSEDDVRIVATVIDTMKRERLEKLITHKSKKFNAMRTRRIEVQKVFHTEPVECIDYNKQLMDRVNQLLK